MQYVRTFRPSQRVDRIGERPGEPPPAAETAFAAVPTGTDAPVPETAASARGSLEDGDWYSYLDLSREATLAEIQARIHELGTLLSAQRGVEFGDETAGRHSTDLMDAVAVFSDQRRRVLHDELLAKNPGRRIGAAELRSRELQLSLARASAVEARHRMEHGDREEAIRLLRKAIELDPDATSYRSALEACADPEHARQVLRAWFGGPAR